MRAGVFGARCGPRQVRERFGGYPLHLEARAKNHAIVAERMVIDLHGVWGAADYSDDWIVVWDLDRLRAGGTSGLVLPR